MKLEWPRNIGEQKQIYIRAVEYLENNRARKNVFMSTIVAQHILLSGQEKNPAALFKVLYMNRTGRMNLFMYVGSEFIIMSHKLWLVQVFHSNGNWKSPGSCSVYEAGCLSWSSVYTKIPKK